MIGYFPNYYKTTMNITDYITQRLGEFDEKFILGDDVDIVNDPKRIKSFHSETITTVMNIVREMVEKGNLDPDFEYKKEYYNGHNELQQYIISQLPNLETK